MVTIGIDPGAGGGVAVCDDGLITLHAMPKGELAIAELITRKLPSIAWVEQVSGFIGTPHPGSRMFNFGANYGCILGALHALEFLSGNGCEVNLVRPQKWQKWLDMGNRSSSNVDKSEWKRMLKREAMLRHPNLIAKNGKRSLITDKTADALLILDYGLSKQK
jgi:hypothetical protein